MKPSKLSEHASKILKFIIKEIRENNMPPTVSEMTEAFKYKSKRSISIILDELVTKGYIKVSGLARGITVLNSLSESLEKGMVRVPLLGRVQAGGPTLAEEHIEEWINLPQNLTKGRRDVFLLKVRGDSMINAGIFEGDLVIVRPTREARNNDIVVALLHDEATVKRYIQIKNRAYLKAENPDYKDIYPKEEWMIQGKVVGVIRNLE